MNTIVDADALVALFNSTDALHDKAKEDLNKLKSLGYDTLILPTTISEFATVAGKEVGYKKTQTVVKALVNSGIIIVEITDSLTKQAIDVYLKHQSKKDTLFDCFIIAAAKNLGISYIFSYDNIYKKSMNGLSLVEDLS